MPNYTHRERGKAIFEASERGLPTITPSTDCGDTSAIVIFTIQARTHELGDTIANATRRTAYRYYIAATDSDMELITNTVVTGATFSGGIALIPDSTTAQFHHGTIITNSTGGMVARFYTTSGISVSLVLITPDGLIAASTEHSSSST